MSQFYHRHSKVSVDVVLPLIDTDKKEKELVNGVLVKVASDRLSVFKSYGLSCARCGIKGSFFAIERDRAATSFHLNLWALSDTGEEVQMTQYRKKETMCIDCNRKQYVIDRKGKPNA